MAALSFLPPRPWLCPSQDLQAELSGFLSVDALTFGILDLDSPQPHSILTSTGFTAASVLNWLRVGIHRDAIFRECQTSHAAHGLLADTPLALPGPANDSFLLHNLLPIGIGNKHWWLCVARTGTPFSAAQRDTCLHLLQYWLGQLSAPSETGLHHLIVSDDGHAIYTDPLLLHAFQKTGTAVQPFVNLVQECIDQRWPECEFDDPHDLVLPLGNDVVWVTARKRISLGIDSSVYWVYECRPPDSDELPAVGVLPDDRIAWVLAYLHDYYFNSPSLNELAAQVHISPFHFHRLFAKQVGVSPKQYLLHKQMQVGRWRLRLGFEPIGEIAVATGFANHAHFTSTFRRMFENSPSEYQLQYHRTIDALAPYGAATEARSSLRTSPDFQGDPS